MASSSVLVMFLLSIVVIIISIMMNVEAQRSHYSKSSNISLDASLSPKTNLSSWLSPSGRFAFGFYPQGDGFTVGIWLFNQPEFVENTSAYGFAGEELQIGPRCAKIALRAFNIGLAEYIEDGDLRRWRLPDIRAFNIGLAEWRSKLNCFTNPYMYEQLLEISATDAISKGKSHISSREKSANKLLDKALKIRLGRGFYGECLGVRADENSELSDEIGKQLSVKSAAAGLRPIGAVIFMQRRNLKMCLRSHDTSIDTSEVAKAYGGGGTPSSSSFIIRMDEYNQWISGNSR